MPSNRSTQIRRTIPAVLALAALTLPAANAWAAPPGPATRKATSKAKPKSVARVATKTFTGPSVDMRWGPVQVVLVVQGKRILDVRATAPADRARSAFINNQALPLLRTQVLQQQGIENVYAISGATMTSEAYGQSLQAALDQAHL